MSDFKGFGRFQTFLRAMSSAIDSTDTEESLLAAGAVALKDLVGNDDWLPDEYAVADADRYQQFLLHCDPDERFSVVSFVWAAGQETPVHDHCTWGLVGVLRGIEWSQKYAVTRCADGRESLEETGPSVEAGRGEVDAVSPRLGDIHRVANRSADVAISIHVYGGNIGTIRRHVYGDDGTRREFISGYAPTPYAQLWSEPTKTT